MFEGFEPVEVAGADGRVLRGRAGGDPAAPPVLLLHGYPQTHAMWHAVAPRLAETHRVILFDLPGYGDSDAPPLTADHAPYAKGAWAVRFAEAMEKLGHARFALAGHDRGARAAYRLALDHPGRVTRLALLDIVPTVSMWELAGARFCIDTFHWGFLAQPAPFPEKMIEGDPDRFLDYCIAKWAAPGFRFDPTAQEAYRAAFRRPGVIAATCEDYRAGATIDVAADRETRAAGVTYDGPSLLVWGAHNFGRDTDAIRGLWQTFLAAPEGVALDCGHFVAEERPDETTQALSAFLAAP